MDYLATLNQINTGGTGYGAKLMHSLLCAHTLNWDCMPFTHMLPYMVGTCMVTNCS